jgi:L-lactate dehydrogenase complex protein LldG
MSSKKLILNTLRQSQVNNSLEIPPLTADSKLYADTVPVNETMIQRFEKIITQLRGEFFHFKKTSDAAEFLQRLITEFGSESCLSYNFELLRTLISLKKTLKDHIKINSGQLIPASEFAQYEVGITARLSILPPVHIVLAYSSQMVSSIEDIWIDMADRQSDWSTLSIISGPSRTSDIEKQLVLGAHGPKRLVVILINTE